MDYQIIRFNNGHRRDGSETWKGHPLTAVQDHAREIIDMGLAERVEVRDESDTLVFQWPRTVKVASQSPA
ncbi:hypothetical protein BRX36_21330 [Sphingomonas sp. S-NIH.Pt1_0416]|jgi:hypothetical protein|uniref:hypothetical protein n=1 Tax=Sphingomonas TaxID=13687 RepID=UPI00064B9533|nr:MULTISPECIES: hypothetical protein [Sphingomonas]RSU56600.1 hypothetical protein BRX36_21330 [Sphingomonas sp. S-NIH.Pt1_0416]